MQSSVCFAEISTDNPNVWYELGYAIAKGREVVLLCSHERPTEFPFDVQHRNITTYSTDSPSDFEKVHAEITARLKAVRAQGTPQRVKAPDTSVTGVEELEQYEMAGLVAATLGFDATSGVSIQEFEKYMKRQNFNRLAATLACQALFDKEMLEKFEHEGFGDGLRATPKGVRWLISNRDRLELSTTSQSSEKQTEVADDLPF